LKLTAVKKFWAVKANRMTMTVRPTATGRLPRFPPLKFSQTRVTRFSSGGATSKAGAVSVVTRGCLHGNSRDFRRCTRGDRVHDLLLRRRLAIVEPRVAAEPKNGDPISDREDVVEIVRDENDREPLLTEPLDERKHLLGLGYPQSRRRLVEDDELR